MTTETLDEATTAQILRHNYAQIIGGELDPMFLAQPIQIAHHVSADRETGWKTQDYTWGSLIAHLSEFGRGPKDGHCILQGGVIADRRLAKDATKNICIMVDYDDGTPLAHALEAVKAKGLCAVFWTTHSHLKAESTIAEQEIIDFVKKVSPGDAPTLITTDLIRRYMREVKGISAAIVATMEWAPNDWVQVPGKGRSVRVTHAPMPRFRILLPLAAPFVFADGSRGTHEEAMEEWRERYRGVSQMLGLPEPDSKCIDPARLMYTPRIARDAMLRAYPGGDEIIVLNGNPLDITTVPRIAGKGARAKAAGAGNRFQQHAAGGRGGKKTYVTAHLWEAFCKYGRDLQTADMLEAIAPEDRRRGTPTIGEGINFCCPNEQAHTTVSADDTAFMVTNSAGEISWKMLCHHATCTNASEEDRLWYLDRALEKYGITDAMPILREYSLTGQAEIAAEEAAAKQKVDLRSNIEEALAAISTQSKIEDVEALLRLMAERGDKLRDGDDVKALARQTGKSVKVLRECLAQLCREALKNERAQEDDESGAALPHPVPSPLGEAAGIWLDWDWSTVVEVTKARVRFLNKQNPTLFQRAEGGCYRVQENAGRSVVVRMRETEWAAELSGCLPDGSARLAYKVAANGREQGVAPPRELKQILVGANDLQLPVLNGVAHCPLFALDGTLRTAKGYDPELKIYLDPKLDFHSVAEKPSDDEVARAGWLLSDALVDFPFSDAFGEQSDHEPIKLETRDEDGWPRRNPHRGAGSFANALAMIIQPHVQHLIDGSCPAYHVDKSSPGTGAGYLVDVAHVIAEGARAVVSTMSTNNEEFRKTITASLRSGARIIFVDNINHRIDSGDLAAALTSGVWRDRTLGVSEIKDTPVKAMWIMAGNNLTFSHELMRRNVPILMDAATPDPDRDRGPGDFKHWPLQDWLFENRRELVWAVHTLIANWFAKGRPRGSVTLGSFEKWAATMAGILECAGVQGFLSNLDDYMQARDEDRSGLAEFVQVLFSVFGFQNSAEISDLLELAKGKSGEPLFGIHIDTEKKLERQAQQLGQWMNRNVTGKTFDVLLTAPKKAFPGMVTPDSGGADVPQAERVRVQLRKSISAGRARYTFVRMRAP